MSTLTEIEAAAAALPVNDKARLLKFVAESLQQTALSTSPGARHPGLHEGAWDVAPDFDAPLPEDIWTGS
jgi:hypothetical protein